MKKSNDILDNLKVLAVQARQETPLDVGDLSGDVIRTLKAQEAEDIRPVASSTPMTVFTLVYTAAAMICCVFAYSLWSEITDPLYSMVYMASSVTQL